MSTHIDSSDRITHKTIRIPLERIKMPEFTRKIRFELKDLLKNTEWEVWENSQIEYPIRYRDELVNLGEPFKKLLGEMNERGSRNPSSDICLYSVNRGELVLIEIDEVTTNISNIIKVWFYVENRDCFFVKLSGGEEHSFEPENTKVLHFIPKNDPPYWKMLTHFLTEQIEESGIGAYELIDGSYKKGDLYHKRNGKEVVKEKVKGVLKEIKQRL